MVKTKVATVSIAEKEDEINSEYEFSNEDDDKIHLFLQKEKGIKDFAWEGNMFSIEYTDKKSVTKLKKLMDSLSKDKSKNDKVLIEWDYWQYSE